MFVQLPIAKDSLLERFAVAAYSIKSVGAIRLPLRVPVKEIF